MLVFDASSIIYAWDNYPIKQFPGLWEWMEKEIEDGKFKIPDVAYDEVGDNAPECQKWLKNVDIERLPITSGILSKALFIKNLLGIEEDQYGADGVGENDILIIACAKINGATLVSDEALQTNLPSVWKNMKIPAVCNLDEVDVRCINFLRLIKNSKEVF